MSHMQPTSDYKIKIVSGLHKDAELDVKSGLRYTVGSGDACDIILSDSGIESEHVRFTLLRDGISLETLAGDVCVDGKSLSKACLLLADYQVVTIGTACFAIGPTNQRWPRIEPPVIKKASFYPTARDLVPVFTTDRRSEKYRRFEVVRQFVQTLVERIGQADRKVLAGFCGFVLALAIFFFDMCQPFSAVDARFNECTPARLARLQPKSTLLAIVDGLSSVGQHTCVGTGLTEPPIPVEVEPTRGNDQPIEHLRRALRKTWGRKLSESHVDDREIFFKGFDDNDQQDLALTITHNDSGDIQATATTLTKKKKKALLSQLGDTVCLKINAAEDMENVCQRVLEKKGIRQPRVIYDLHEKSFTLNGLADDQASIPVIQGIVSKAFPGVGITNKLKIKAPASDRLSIRSVCSGAAAHIVEKDGAKVFKGGKLENGCTLLDIQGDHLRIICDGVERSHRL